MADSKTEVFDRIRQSLKEQGLSIKTEDQTRPWGGFFVLDEKEIVKFLELFFETVDPSEVLGGKVSPKILLVAPNSRLSWQYHNRRAEIWTVVAGPVQIALSDTDFESDVVTLQTGETISLRQGQRHRLIGLSSWGIVAEIWQHTDELVPSDEEDIIRVQDDYKR